MSRFNKGFPISTWTRPGKLLSTTGTLKDLAHGLQTFQVSPADGDKMLLEFSLRGTETKLYIGLNKTANNGIMDVYLNDVNIASTIDMYNAGTLAVYITINLTDPIKKGNNTLEFRINGKNALSANYYAAIFGASFA